MAILLNLVKTANIRISEGIIATPNPEPGKELNDLTANESLNFMKVITSDCVLANESMRIIVASTC